MKDSKGLWPTRAWSRGAALAMMAFSWSLAGVNAARAQNGEPNPDFAFFADAAAPDFEEENPVEVAPRDPPPLPGDLNGDNAIDWLDINYLFTHFGQPGMNASVLAVVLANWAPPPVYILPLEPTETPRNSWQALVYAVGGVSSVRMDGRPIAYDSSSRLAVVERGSSGRHVIKAIGVRGAVTEMTIFLGSANWDEVVAPYPGAPWSKDIRMPGSAENIVMRGWAFGTSGEIGVKAQRGNRDTRQVWLQECTATGDGSPVPMASPTDWRGGIWIKDCVVDNIKALPADSKGICGLRAGTITADLMQNALAAYDVRCRFIKKIEDTVHPDCVQGSFKNNPGPVAFSTFYVEEGWSQGVFFRCDEVEAIGLFNFTFIEAPESRYLSQIKGPLVHDLVIDGLTIRNQGFTICHDTSRRVKILRYEIGAVDVEGGLRIDPTSGIDYESRDNAGE